MANRAERARRAGGKDKRNDGGTGVVSSNIAPLEITRTNNTVTYPLARVETSAPVTEAGNNERKGLSLRERAQARMQETQDLYDAGGVKGTEVLYGLVRSVATLDQLNESKDKLQKFRDSFAERTEADASQLEASKAQVSQAVATSEAVIDAFSSLQEAPGSNWLKDSQRSLREETIKIDMAMGATLSEAEEFADRELQRQTAEYIKKLSLRKEAEELARLTAEAQAEAARQAAATTFSIDIGGRQIGVFGRLTDEQAKRVESNLLAGVQNSDPARAIEAAASLTLPELTGGQTKLEAAEARNATKEAREQELSAFERATSLQKQPLIDAVEDKNAKLSGLREAVSLGDESVLSLREVRAALISEIKSGKAEGREALQLHKEILEKADASLSAISSEREKQDSRLDKARADFNKALNSRTKALEAQRAELSALASIEDDNQRTKLALQIEAKYSKVAKEFERASRDLRVAKSGVLATKRRLAKQEKAIQAEKDKAIADRARYVSEQREYRKIQERAIKDTPEKINKLMENKGMLTEQASTLQTEISEITARLSELEEAHAESREYIEARYGETREEPETVSPTVSPKEIGYRERIKSYVKSAKSFLERIMNNE